MSLRILLICFIFFQSTTIGIPVKYTLDPSILAEVNERIKAATAPETSIDKADIGIRLLGGAQGEVDKIIFEDPDDNDPVSLHASRSTKEATISFTLNNRNSINPQHKCADPKERYHVESGKCYIPGTHGPCHGDNMIFYSQEGNKIYGSCDCDYDAEIPLVFHTESSKCYPIYEQAYCKPNEWLVFDKSDNPICESRKCPKEKSKTIVYFNENCVEFYKGHKSCQKSYEKIIFLPDGLQPVCAEPPSEEQSNINIPKLKCRPGSSEDIRGNCRKKIQFNFNG